MCWGFCGQQTFSDKTITLPITFSSSSYVVCTATLNTSNTINMRVQINSPNQIGFNRTGAYNGSGWYFCIGP